MARGVVLFMAALLTAASSPTFAGAQGVEGTWRLSVVSGGLFEQTFAIVKLKTEAGKTTGELIAASPGVRKPALKAVTQDGNVLRVVLQVGTVEYAFATAVPKEAAKRLLGTMVVDGTVYPGWLAATDEMTLDQKTAARALDCPPMQALRMLSIKGPLLRFRAKQEKDTDKKEAVLKEAAEADQVANKETPKFYREVLDKHADQPAVFDAALGLLRSAQARDAKLDEVKGWATIAAKAAQAYGPRWEAEFTARVTAALLTQEGFASLVLPYARQAESTLTPQSSAADQVRVLSLLARALRKSGQEDDAKNLDARVAKLDLVLDREYLAKMPPFKAAAFTGRNSMSKRAVFMELFTGATCPPCVAADLAFDVLQQTYKPADLVLIQYHMHIPGPDPLANPDTEARWQYYTEAFSMEVRGVPTCLFNGKPAAFGGGGFDDAERTYDRYRKLIDPLLEEPAGAKLDARARLMGDRIDIQVDVADLAEPKPTKKLRILLAEETIRYAGSNKIRFHHNVVRAFPGGVAGQALTEAASKHKASIRLGDLRSQLTKYLDDFQTSRPFANPARPLEFKNLRVIAFVQDDATHAILQAVQVEVETK